MSAEEEVKTDLSNPDVVTKYRTAGDITNNAMTHVIAMCTAGAKIVDICSAGDAFINEATGKLYNKGKGKVEKANKGVGFPTCLSINNVVGHFSPLDTDESTLAEGDMVKIDLGTQIDGYCSVGAHTLVVGAEAATGRAGDVLAAAYTASELALRMLKIGAKNTAITEMISKVADDFKCSAVQGVLSHQMNQFVIDGDKVILNKADKEQKVQETEFEPNEVYAMDIVISTGEGKPKEIDAAKTTVYKREQDQTYQLKMKASRAVLADISKNFPAFPFTLRSLEAKKTARFGISECIKHELVSNYPVLTEKDGELVAHVKFTALLMPSGTIRVTQSNLDPSKFQTECKLSDEDMVKLLATSAGKKKKKKNNKKKKKTEAQA